MPTTKQRRRDRPPTPRAPDPASAGGGLRPAAGGTWWPRRPSAWSSWWAASPSCWSPSSAATTTRPPRRPSRRRAPAPPRRATAPTPRARRRRPRTSASPPNGKVPTTGTVTVNVTTSRGPIDLLAGPRQGALRGQQLQLPGEQEVLRRHAVPPAHHRRAVRRAAVRRPGRHRRGRAGLQLRRRDRPRTGSTPRACSAMANSGADTNGSQFFIVYRDTQLPPNYTVFGTVTQGPAGGRGGGEGRLGQRERRRRRQAEAAGVDHEDAGRLVLTAGEAG